MKILRSMTHGIRDQFTYSRRIEKGVQSPDETLRVAPAVAVTSRC